MCTQKTTQLITAHLLFFFLGDTRINKLYQLGTFSSILKDFIYDNAAC